MPQALGFTSGLTQRVGNSTKPENLLWLCSNHHIAYDDGLFGPDAENAEFVVSFKKVLHRYKLLLWRTQHKISSKLLTVLEDCDALEKQLAAAKTKEQILKFGFIPVANRSVGELQDYVKSETARWGKVVSDAGLAGSQ